MDKIDSKQEASLRVQALLDSEQLEPELLLRWLDGIGWPWEIWAERYRMLLDTLPLRSQQLPRYRENLAQVAAKLLKELATNGGYPPEYISHRALGEFFLLCACLASPSILGPELRTYYELMSLSGEESLDATQRYALRVAIERNQIDDIYKTVWIRMIAGQERFFPGVWQDGLDALGRCFHARIQKARDTESEALALTQEFRLALRTALPSALKVDGSEETAAREIREALEYWETSCPGLRKALPVFLLDSLYRSETPGWLKSILECKLKAAGIPPFEKMVEIAANMYSEGLKQPIDKRKLATTTHQLLADQDLSIITKKRLANILSQAAGYCLSTQATMEAIAVSSPPAKTKPTKLAEEARSEKLAISKDALIGVKKYAGAR